MLGIIGWNFNALPAPVFHLKAASAPAARKPVPNLHSSTLSAQSQGCHQKLALISKINNSLAEAKSKAELFETLARSIFFLFPRVQVVYIHQVEPEIRSLSCVYAAQNEPSAGSLWPGCAQPPGRKRSGSERTAAAPPGGDQRSFPLHLADHHKCSALATVQSMLAVPMLRRCEVEGVLEVMSSVQRRFGPVELELLTLLANTATNALEGLRLNKDLSESTNQMNHVYDAAVEGWRRALELRDRATEGHGSPGGRDDGAAGTHAGDINSAEITPPDGLTRDCTISARSACLTVCCLSPGRYWMRMISHYAQAPDLCL